MEPVHGVTCRSLDDILVTTASLVGSSDKLLVLKWWEAARAQRY
jgi:hypothetical protein